jgi:hypothetical protein
LGNNIKYVEDGNIKLDIVSYPNKDYKVDQLFSVKQFDKEFNKIKNY